MPRNPALIPIDPETLRRVTQSRRRPNLADLPEPTPNPMPTPINPARIRRSRPRRSVPVDLRAPRGNRPSPPENAYLVHWHSRSARPPPPTHRDTVYLRGGETVGSIRDILADMNMTVTENIMIISATRLDPGGVDSAPTGAQPTVGEALVFDAAERERRPRGLMVGDRVLVIDSVGHLHDVGTTGRFLGTVPDEPTWYIIQDEATGDTQSLLRIQFEVIQR